MNESSSWHSIFSVDPGGISGWSFVMAKVPLGMTGTEVDLVREAMGRGWYRGGQIDSRGGEDPVVDRILELHQSSVRWTKRNFGEDPVVYSFLSEDFIIRMFNSSRSFLSPVRINSKLDYLFHRGEIEADHYLHYSPSSAKTVSTDDRMKGILNSTRNRPHEIDSIRHIVLHLRKIREGKIQ